MPKKNPLTRLHKIKIHKNRWLIWAIAYLVMVAIAMVGYLKVSDLNFQTAFPPYDNLVSWRPYTDMRLGFSVRYPKDWGIEADSQSTISFLPANTNQEGVAISVYSLSAEANVRKSLNIVSEKIITVDKATGSIITNNLGKNLTESVALVKNNGKLFVISGPDNSVQKFLLTFRFIQTSK